MNESRLDQESFFSEYVNNIDIGVSRFDISINFARSKGDTKKELGEVILSPIHAKLLLHLLNNNIQTYETLFGEISLKEPTQEELLEVQASFTKE